VPVQEFIDVRHLCILVLNCDITFMY